MKRYALARPAGAGQPRPEDGLRRLRLVRMEQIAEREREARSSPGADQGLPRSTPPP